MKLGITYTVVTPERRALDSGWMLEPIEATLREVAEVLTGRCFVHVQRTWSGLSFYCEPFSGFNGNETEETVHVSDIHPLAYKYLINAFKA